MVSNAEEMLQKLLKENKEIREEYEANRRIFFFNQSRRSRFISIDEFRNIGIWFTSK